METDFDFATMESDSLDAPIETGRIDPSKQLSFIFAGKAIFTLVSQRTGSRYTFAVSKSKPNPQFPKQSFFVGLLAGPDNTRDYRYIGMIPQGGGFRTTRASKLSMSATPVQAFNWFMNCLMTGKVHGVEVYHAGRCARCARRLTVPESIASGFGPECMKLAA